MTGFRALAIVGLLALLVLPVFGNMANARDEDHNKKFISKEESHPSNKSHPEGKNFQGLDGREGGLPPLVYDVQSGNFQCDLSVVGACNGDLAANPATGSKYNAGRVISGKNAVIPVDAPFEGNLYRCRYLDNTSSDESYFVPFKSDKEWRSFLDNAPTAITKVNCSKPYGLKTVAAALPPYVGCSGTIMIDTPQVYARYVSVGEVWTPDPDELISSFSCHAGGTEVTASNQWRGLNSDVEEVGKSWKQELQYSPDVVFTATDTSNGNTNVPGSPLTVTLGTTVQLNWDAKAFDDSDVTVAAKSPEGFAAGPVAKGFVDVTPTESTTYEITARPDDVDGRDVVPTSTASVRVIVNSGTCVAGWGAGELTYDGPPGSGDAWAQNTTYGKCTSGEGGHTASTKGSITMCAYGEDNLGYIRRCGGGGAATLNFDPVKEDAVEGTSLEFTVKLSEPAKSTITVNYTTSAATATEGTDYLKATGKLTFLAKETTKRIVVVTKTDVVAESDETFRVTLSNPVNANIGEDGVATGTILDKGVDCTVFADETGGTKLYASGTSTFNTFMDDFASPTRTWVSTGHQLGAKCAGAGRDQGRCQDWGYWTNYVSGLLNKPNIPKVCNDYVPYQCRGDINRDIVYVVDDSGSIGTESYKLVKQFLTTLTQQLAVKTGDHIGISKFSTYLNYLSAGMKDDSNDIVSEIANLNYTSGGTDIRDGLFGGANLLVPYNNYANTKTVILVTDGGHNTPAGSSASEASEPIKAGGYRLIGVGVGKYFDPDTLRPLVSSPSADNMFVVGDFDDMQSIVSSLAASACGSEDVGPFNYSIHHVDVVDMPDNDDNHGGIPPDDECGGKYNKICR